MGGRSVIGDGESIEIAFLRPIAGPHGIIRWPGGWTKGALPGGGNSNLLDAWAERRIRKTNRRNENFKL